MSYYLGSGATATPDYESVQLTVSAAARMAGVTTKTIRRWTSSGRLPYSRAGGDGHRRIARDDLVRFLDQAPAPTAPRSSTISGTAPRRTVGAPRSLLSVLARCADDVDELLPCNPRRLTVGELDRLRHLLGGPNAVDDGRSGLLGDLRSLLRDVDNELDDRRAESRP